MDTSKEVGLYSPLPFPYACKNENDPSHWSLVTLIITFKLVLISKIIQYK